MNSNVPIKACDEVDQRIVDLEYLRESIKVNLQLFTKKQKEWQLSLQ